MPIRIVHLSDLHYGGSFDHVIWNAVTQQVREFDPGLLIVSGDLVDFPTERRLRAAKRLLDELAASSDAELFVVPGNHDVSPFGIDLFGTRSALFYKIFDCKAGQPGAGQPPVLPAKDDGGLKSFWRRAKSCIDLALHGSARSRPMTATAVRSAARGNVRLALVDSNAADRKIGLATGSVSSDDLVRLGGELEGIPAKLRSTEMAHLVRIMVLHHHPLPVANTDGGLVGAEPFMVLHNAGDVTDFASRHSIDLILHGHKHQQQLQGILPSIAAANSYPIVVAAAGSAARRSNDPRANSFNFITIEDNGRITVESIHYGGSTVPGRAATTERYTESMEIAKLRAFVRASQRCDISSREETFHFRIDELGDLMLEHQTIGLRTRGNGDLSSRPHIITLPKHGEVARELQLVQTSADTGYRIDKAPAAPLVSAASRTRQLEWLVALPAKFHRGDEANYTVRHSFSNSVVMTRWEAQERARSDEREGTLRSADWDQESVGCQIRHPIEKLQLLLSVPRSLEGAYPYLCCERPTGFPNFPITQWGDVELSPDVSFDRDTEMEAAEGQIPYHDKGGIWRWTVEHPVVGYRYRLRWLIPGQHPEGPLPSETEEWRHWLLACTNDPTRCNEKVQLAFAALADEFRKRLASGDRHETWSVELLVYDAGKLALQPVARGGSKPPGNSSPQFSVGLGNGIAGAAFQKRAIVP